MAIPGNIKILHGELPPKPGVYFMKDARGRIMYIGKATSLRTRVGSYFVRPADARIAAMVEKIRVIDYRETPTAIEALILESRLIKKYQPRYNVMEKDDKSFVHLAFTREPFPQPVLVRAYELARMPKRQFLKTFGPFRSASAVQAALDALRRSFPWSTCGARAPAAAQSRAVPRDGARAPAAAQSRAVPRGGARARAAAQSHVPNTDAMTRPRPCFYRHLGLCPGVCTGEIASAEYMVIIRELMDFFDGKRAKVVRELKRRMASASAAERFEDAAALRDRIGNLERLRDVGVIKREQPGIGDFIDIFGRIEGYDISNIMGEAAVGSMVVFKDGEPSKRDYRRFLIKTVRGANDTAMIQEVLYRRFGHGSQGEKWPKPDLLLIDGGAGQINAAKLALMARGIRGIPIIGIAKGFDRKQDQLMYDRSDYELSRLVHAFKPLLQHLRDEAHRYAITYHRQVRGRRFLKS